jgi:hypothetical protein
MENTHPHFSLDCSSAARPRSVMRHRVVAPSAGVDGSISFLTQRARRVTAIDGKLENSAAALARTSRCAAVSFTSRLPG